MVCPYLRRFRLSLSCLLVLSSSLGWAVLPSDRGNEVADKSLVVDGSAVLNTGSLHLNITNWGLIGSRYSEPSSFFGSPSAQWPGGSGHEYLFAAGLWIGGWKQGTPSVSCGQPETELRPSLDPRDVLYESKNMVQIRPNYTGAITGVPADLANGDDDGDGLLDEDPLDGYDQDGDGLIDEDYAQRGSQMFTCLMRDDDPLTQQMYPDHRPLGVEIRQDVCSWDTQEEEDVVGFRWVITNRSSQPIEHLYVGFMVDGDIGRHNDPGGGRDDLAGTFTGMVRQPEEYYEDLAYVYMRDGAVEDALPGWIAASINGTGFGDAKAVRPSGLTVRAQRVFNNSFSQGPGGFPMLDTERYALMSQEKQDNTVPPEEYGDYIVMISVGPYDVLKPGEYVVVEASLLVAPGQAALHELMRKSRDLARGRWYNADGRYSSGWGGRESKVCAEDMYYPWYSMHNPLFHKFADFWDESCKPRMLFILPIEMEDLFWEEDTNRHCVYVNMDNCLECGRAHGVVCTGDGNGFSSAGCYGNSPRVRGACTGFLGREEKIPWVNSRILPPPPWMRLVPRNYAMELYWDNRSEVDPVYEQGVTGFESYRIWRADNWDRPVGTSQASGPPADAWSLKAEYDVINYLPGTPGEFPPGFGRNTGLEDIRYRPVCLDDPMFEGLEEAMTAVVHADVEGQYEYLPPLRDGDGVPVPGLEGLLRWEGYPAVLDTFFKVTERPEEVGVPKAAVKFYMITDPVSHNGWLYFYSVTATDHILTTGNRILRAGTGTMPSGSFTSGRSRFDSVAAEDMGGGSYEVFVYPNPATREALDGFQPLNASASDPTGVRVSFVGMPSCRSTIKIFTLAGDLVQTVEHDGSGGDGQAYWNLITYNGQEIVSGIYLFTVEPEDSRFENFVGKFVVVR